MSKWSEKSWSGKRFGQRSRYWSLRPWSNFLVCGSGSGRLNEVVIRWWSQSSRLLDGLSVWTWKRCTIAENAGEVDTGSQVPKSSMSKGGSDWAIK